MRDLLSVVLTDFGYGDLIGEEDAQDALDRYCEERGVQRRAVASATDNATVSEFLDWLLPKLNGFGGGGAAADGDAAGAADGGGYASPDYSYSGSEGEDGEDADSGAAAMAGSDDEAGEGASGSDDEAMAEAGDSDVEIVGEASGDEFEIEAIEESSSEDDEPLAARTRRPSSGGRRPLPGAALVGGGAMGTGGGTAVAAAAAAGGGGGGQRSIDAFVQRVPRGQASVQALAGPPPAEGRQQAGAMAMRPASAEEQQLDMLDYANRMVFGNPSFRSRQRDIVEAALSGRNCFVLMPTGGGKSLTYQLPAVLSRGITVVVTPLLSLMQDQVQALNGLACGGVPTTYLSSQQTETEARAVHLELCKPRPSIKLLYVTPEQLVKGERLKRELGTLHSRGLLARIVIDEAHCVSAWGHDFRPDYKLLGVVAAEHFPGVPLMALTATATHKVRQDIVTTLRMRAPAQFTVSFFRPNLLFRVIQKDYSRHEESGLEGYLHGMLTYIQNHPEGSGIVYCLSRDNTETVAATIRQYTDISAAHYHAGMTPKQRMQVQNDWRTGAVKVVVATIAFGMGVDKADVRYVIHFTLSKSMEGYYQEAGRAGRDGLPSECLLYYAKRDVPHLLNVIRMGKKSKAAFQREVELVDQMRAYCEDDQHCRHAQLIQYFGETWQQGRCATHCDVCRGEVAPPPPEQQKQRQRRDRQRPSSGGGGGSGRAGGKGKGGAAAAAVGFQSAAVVLQQQGGGGQQAAAGPAGSSRALKMQQAAMAAHGWRFKKSSKEKENPAALAKPADFVTAAQLEKQQRQQHLKAAIAGGGRPLGGGKQGGGKAAGQSATIDSFFRK
ncbi:ATP-dependent DNA helicase Q-like 1 isoform A [Chlorella sorokiniana]|uniref:ATP-dependent DNA helicase n=1 Tax=Chlorella sorokiniana TaxID=3076 RepID=A0A2P6TV87_CHLSO|nr:ATP-dependent DNA helicase Q-like 1 isoform A [Chlorella sorokiniana]|eukprot:PRW57979.1 ATP-dependent DNA helicase Q-like 1 isoform A [Chlorella sorokiniana]